MLIMLGAMSMDMSGTGGDIWSTGAFSFESPLKDLLDSGDFTLEQLLAEDELLQELRGCHPKLIAYFSTEKAVTKLVEYVIMPHPLSRGNGESSTTTTTTTTTTKPGEWLVQHMADKKTGNINEKGPEKDPALKHIRFPYMACEIICCEIPGMIDALVKGRCVFTENKKQNATISDPAEDSAAADAEKKEPSPTSSVTEIVTSDSQGDMVEVMAKRWDDDDDVADVSDANIENRPAILDLLFSVLHETAIGQLDDYRAGYFDKILTVLFRKQPEELTVYINKGGSMGRDVLIRSMLNHLYSHSIMQIAQRLLLPQRPVENEEQQQQQQQGGDEIVAGDEDDEAEGAVQCDWGNSPEVWDMLLEILIGPDRSLPSTRSVDEEEQILDLSLNASEVLITIIQNSMLSSPTMLSLTSSATVSRIVDAATTLPGGDFFSPHESLLTSAMNVLESLVLQLGGYGAVGTMSLMPEEELALNHPQQREQGRSGDEHLFEEDPPEQPKDAAIGKNGSLTDPNIADVAGATRDDGEEVVLEDKHLISDLGSMLDHLPRLLEQLSNLLRHPSTKTWTSPTQFSRSKPQQMLGNSRLRIVRVLESLVLLGDPEVDFKLVQSDCLKLCLDFFWEFQWCSMLHQSVANLLVHVFEGQNTRIEMQEYFLVKCNLLGRLMDSFAEGEVINGACRGAVLSPSSSVTRLADVVENSQDVATTAGAFPSLESEKGNTLDALLPISEDDVDAAMETQVVDNLETGDTGGHGTGTATPNADLVSTEATRFESRDVSTIGDATAAPPSQAFRFGYMGHVIIICQALVHAYLNDQREQEMIEGGGTDDAGESTGSERENGYLNKNGEISLGKVITDEGFFCDEPIGPKDDFGEPLLLFEIVHTHALAERWHDFVDTTLAAETAVQSTPLGGFSARSPGMDMLHSHRPGLADEGYMLGDNGEGPPVPPRGMLGGGDVIDMDDNDLDIAASMMAGLSMGRPTAATDGDDDRSINSGDSDGSYNSGETAKEKTSYSFDDPLGKAGGLGIELGKLTRYKHGGAATFDSSKAGDDDSHSSSDEEHDSHQSGDGDVPVIDLFAGNFHYEQPLDANEASQTPDFANFADFDSAGNSIENTLDAFAGVTGQHELTEGIKVADLDEIFGQGDHAELLELDDGPPEAPSPQIDPANYLVEVLQEREASANQLAAAIESVVMAGQVAGGDLPPGQDELLTAPSDELRADMNEQGDEKCNLPTDSVTGP